MKKTLIIIIGCLVLVIIIGFFIYLIIKSQNNWQTYSNSRFNFRVQYPPGWKLGEAPTNNDGRTFTSPDGKIECSAYGLANALVTEAGQPQTLKEYIDWLVSQDEIVTVIGKYDTTLAGQPAIELITKELGTINQAVYSLNDEAGRALLCIFQNDQDRIDFQKSFQKMADSFH